MLTDVQIESYHRDGFVVPHFRLCEETLGAIRDRHTRLGVADHSERTLFLMRGADRCGGNDYAPRR